jgi:hypothetical protein
MTRPGFPSPPPSGIKYPTFFENIVKKQTSSGELYLFCTIFQKVVFIQIHDSPIPGPGTVDGEAFSWFDMLDG